MVRAFSSIRDVHFPVTPTDVASNNALNLPQSNDDQSWIAFMDQINGSIDKLELQLRTIHDESSGKEMCALVGAPS